MIVPMKVVTLVGLDADREKIITGLRSLGVLHVELTKRPESRALSLCIENLRDTENSVNALNTFKGKNRDGVTVPDLMPEELLSRTQNELEHLNALKLRLENVSKDVAHLAPWGDFPFGLLKEMENEGVHVYLCEGTPLTYAELPDDAYSVIIAKKKKQLWYVVVAMHPIPLDTLPLATVPHMYTYSEAVRLQATTLESITEAESQLAALSKQVAKLEPLRQRYAEDVEFEANLAGMESEATLVWLSGFVPEPEVEALKAYAQSHGCALQLEDPADDIQPPTKLKNNRFIDLVKPLLDFCGIVPGYREWDVSLMLLCFFTLFAGMIINDMGYGLVFLTGSIIGWLTLGKQMKFRLVLGFATLVSISCILWGMMSASFFGLDGVTLQKIGMGWMVKLGSFTSQPIPWLIDNKAVVTVLEGLKAETDPYKIDALHGKIRQLNVQYFSFALALTQLGLAHVWKAVLAWRKPHILLSHIGWISIMFGNFLLAVNFVVFPDSMPSWIIWLYGIGVPLMCLGVNWKDVSSFFQTPLSLVNGFVDTLSYVRLYAVGLAGGCVAANFNGIIGGLADMGWWMIPIVVIGLIIGHMVNILLSTMGVLVHAIRLNALEFSSHMGLEWTGIAYKPFKRETEEPQHVIPHPKD